MDYLESEEVKQLGYFPDSSSTFQLYQKVTEFEILVVNPLLRQNQRYKVADSSF